MASIGRPRGRKDEVHEARYHASRAKMCARNHGSVTLILLRCPNEVDYVRNKTQQSNDGAGEEQGGVCLAFVGSVSCITAKEERQQEKEGRRQTSDNEIFRLTLHNNQTAARPEKT